MVSFGLSLALLTASALENLTINQYFHQLFRMSLHIKINMIEMLYSKSLRITSGAKSCEILSLAHFLGYLFRSSDTLNFLIRFLILSNFSPGGWEHLEPPEQ